nr:regulator of microtubule dynamics protein 1-like [Procambarus clarkii]XP_045606971.1 regulator of microtubule dynamics protein 1-like [Procambarus clarkii]XP_045606972.1 regulator of microtubule dynamics protein 1-like [Procambarus clarkii]XP_045606973.1 regulator of microtubule dynamics protein 1-like [Procambarus clarkii]XP_045606974.1 regulator of microtubule dynamics protein 1-like [Procambarus clarkii]
MAQISLKVFQNCSLLKFAKTLKYVKKPCVRTSADAWRAVRGSYLVSQASTLLLVKKPGLLRLTGGLLVGFLAIDFPSITAAVPSPERLGAEADRLYELMQYEDIYNLLIVYKDIKNDEILWRLGRATYEKAKSTKTEAERKVLYREALDYVEAALAINPENFAVHKWMAILIDYVYGYEGNKARISQSYNVKNHMMKACELNPSDGTSWYLLGFWYYSIANIPWYQRKIASVVFATPPEGTYEEALKYFLHAEQVAPSFYSKNLLMIGKCYQMLGQNAEAKEYILRTTNYPIKTEDDKEAVAEAVTILRGL